jgi:outer membrane receptor protein involved in Fe transport
VQVRHTFDASPALQVSWGLEYAKQTKPFSLLTELPLVGSPFSAIRIRLHNDDQLESTSAYASLRYKATPELEAQLDLYYQDVKADFLTNTAIEVVGGATLPAPPATGSSRKHEINPRLGVRWRPAPGHTMRIAAQAWRKPAGVNTLAPVDTLGIALDDQIERAGGKLERVRLQHEIEWRNTTMIQWYLDFKRIKNLADPAVVADFALDQLEKLRTRRRTYALRADYLEDTPKFSEGRADLFGVSINHLFTRELTFAARYVNASTRNTSAALSGRDLPFHPRHYFNAGLNWQPRERWIIGPSATYRSHRYRDDANLEPLTAGWGFGLFAYWESEDKRLSLAGSVDQLHSDKQSSIYRHSVAQLQGAYRF